MPSDLENAKLMFLCLQFSTATAFDYKKIGDECGVSAGAASKRMSRLKQAVKAGKEGAGLDVRYLWSCIQHSDMNNVDFKAVGAELGLNPGAASKRWSRLKQALERGETGSAAPANGAPGGKKGSADSNKKPPAGGRKRQNTEAADDEDLGNGSVKKAKGNPSTARKIKAEENGNEDDNSDTVEDDTVNDPENKAFATSKKPAPSRTKAATTGPKKKSSTANADVATGPTLGEANSAPPALHRRRRPLTDEEIYQKLNVDEAEELEKRHMGPHRSAYPRAHNLTETFQALRTPDRKGTAAIFADIAIPNENGGGGGDKDDVTLLGGYPTPINTGSSPSKLKEMNKPTVEDVFSAIAEEAMKSPSAAEERARLKQQKVKEEANTSGHEQSPDWFQVPQNLLNPFIDGSATPANHGSFFSSDEDETGGDEEYV
ncbi:hypothetical protein SLS58_000078 [Diplodia intermedia]|uniref:Myb-like DNA-binding domain-containing protein n=1 Tax=Diplodia intermedia TaxID=856260 RepID=A0ABR3U4Q6_9PEZI